MSVEVTVLFCGAGGDSLGAEMVPGVEVALAMNHWKTAVDVHTPHFPNARHDVADISQADPRRYPRTEMLIGSPECVNHSQAKGISRKKQQASLLDEVDPAAERSRATMWDIARFAEQQHYDVMLVENVVEASKWSGWFHWLGWLTDLGYEHKVLSINSMHFGVPQSRDRIFVAFWRKGLKPDLELEVQGYCLKCDAWRMGRQAWKNGRTIGRYRQQYIWACTWCRGDVLVPTEAALSILDFSLPCPRIGDRKRPLSPKTCERIIAGLIKFGWCAPFVTAGAGNVYETTPGNRSRSLLEPLPVQQATITHALAQPSFLFQTARGGRATPVEHPHPTVCASDDRLALIVNNNFTNGASSVRDPLSTVTTGNRHLLVSLRGIDPGHIASSVVSTDHPLRTVAARGMHHALLMRNNSGGAEMVTSAMEPARTVTTAGHQSLLVPYNAGVGPRSAMDVMPTVTTRDRCALLNPREVLDDCGFRMLEPAEVGLAQGFPSGYVPDGYTKKDTVRLYGNAVTPPAVVFPIARLVRALEEAAR